MVRFAWHRLFFRQVAVGLGISHPRDPSRRSSRDLHPTQDGRERRLGDDIIVTVIEIRGDKVWLAVEHPKRVTIHKREVYEAILSQKKGGQGTEQMSPP